jgi:hemolysin activation/secretion protein
VPNFNVVQQQLIGVSRGDDRRVQPLVRPGRTPGTVETELQVSDQLPMSLNLELNNRQSPDTTPLRLNATFRYDNLFQRDHSLSVVAITTPQDTAQTKVGVISYTLPAGNGATWSLYAVRSNSAVEPVGAATVFGAGSVLGLRYVMPLPGLADLSHSLVLGVDRKHFRERIGASSDSPTTPLIYMPFSLAYNANWQGERSADQVSATVSLASRDLLRRSVTCAGYDTPQDQFACKNPNADGSFTTLRLDWKHTHGLWGRWNGLIRLAGQLSSQPLVSNEQYALGGADTIRGYLEAEASGDRAAMATLELQSPNWLAGKNWWLQELSTQFFVDGGRVYVTDPLAGVPAHTDLLSTGLGLKLRSGKAMTADVAVAWPFETASTYTPIHQPRLHARLAWQF